MKITFLIPYVPIPRMIKRITTASVIEETSVIYWDRGTEDLTNFNLPSNVTGQKIFQSANEGNPFKRIGATIKFCVDAYKLLVKEKPDLIHVTKTDMLMLVWLYCVFKKNRPAVVYEVSDIHHLALNDSKAIKNRIIKKTLFILEKIGLKITDILIVTSEAFWSMYYKELISKEKVIFIPNTPKEEVFSFFSPKNSNSKFKIGYVGKIRYAEQIKLLIDAAEQAGIDVLIAGNGKDLNEIRDYSEGKNHVEIYGSYNYEKDIANIYSGIDCVFSMYDTNVINVRIALPNRLYEAALCNLPILVSKETALAKIVEEEEIGLAIADNDLNDLIEGLKTLKNNKDIRGKMKVNAKTFYEKWRYEEVNKKLIESYTNLLTSR